MGRNDFCRSRREQRQYPSWTTISLVHPAYSEVAGVVLLEAMAAGLLVVVTDNCEHAFHIELARAGTMASTAFDQRTFNQLIAEKLPTGWKPEWKRNGLHAVRRTDVFSLPEVAANLIESVVEKGAHS